MIGRNMTACCRSCKIRLNSTAHDKDEKESTKGASKVRRDHINEEIRTMRQLLPIQPEERERLSYLHSMAAICTFIRKSVVYPELQVEGSGPSLPCEDFLQALPGFIVAMTQEGKLIYVSENVQDYLDYSMVDVLQGDTFYDMVDRADVQVVRSHLTAARVQGTERAFVCRMHTSKPFRLRQDASGCSMLVRGRFQTIPKSSQAPLDLRQTFIALCTPTVNRLGDGEAHSMLGHFQSLHSLDMTFRQMSDSVLFHLGYSVEELIGQSWYGLLHPEDLRICEDAHKRLQKEEKDVTVEIVLRLQHKNLSWVWLYVRAERDPGTLREEVSCRNYIISETEASFLREKTSGAIPGALSLSPPDLPCLPQKGLGWGEGVSRGSKRQREVAGLEKEPWAKRGALPLKEHANHTWITNTPTLLRDDPVFPTTPPISPESPHSLTTPPISPDSAHSPTTPPISPDSADSLILTESQGTDFLCSYGEDFLPPEGSMHSYPRCPGGHFSPPQLLQMVSGILLSPSSLDVPSSQSPESCCNFPATSNKERLVPDFLSETTLDMAFHPEDFSLHAYPPAHPPERTGVFLPVHSTALLTPEPSPTTESPFLYCQDDRVEISILAQQISSLAKSFRMYHNQSTDHRLNPTPRPTLNPALSLTLDPALNPSLNPALNSALNPTINPVLSPTLNPALCPTLSPALNPIFNPVLSPTLNPALCPTLSPALNPILNPVLSPTLNPALCPTLSPALNPIFNPVLSPTLNPVLSPTLNPALCPTLNPVLSPTLNPVLSPTLNPALSLTLTPALCPTLSPALNPIFNPVLSPTLNPALSLTPALSPSFNPAHVLNPTISPALSSTLYPSLSPAPIPTLSHTLTPNLSLPPENYEASSPSPPPEENSLKHELMWMYEDAIDCILKDLDQVPGREATPYSKPSTTYTQVPPCGLEVLEAQGPVVFITTQDEKLLTPPTLDPCTLNLECHGNSNESYQLSPYPCLQEDGLVGESMN